MHQPLSPEVKKNFFGTLIVNFYSTITQNTKVPLCTYSFLKAEELRKELAAEELFTKNVILMLYGHRWPDINLHCLIYVQQLPRHIGITKTKKV